MISENLQLRDTRYMCALKTGGGRWSGRDDSINSGCNDSDKRAFCTHSLAYGLVPLFKLLQRRFVESVFIILFLLNPFHVKPFFLCAFNRARLQLEYLALLFACPVRPRTLVRLSAAMAAVHGTVNANEVAESVRLDLWADKGGLPGLTIAAFFVLVGGMLVLHYREASISRKDRLERQKARDAYTRERDERVQEVAEESTRVIERNNIIMETLTAVIRAKLEDDVITQRRERNGQRS